MLFLSTSQKFLLTTNLNNTQQITTWKQTLHASAILQNSRVEFLYCHFVYQAGYDKPNCAGD